MAFNRSCPFILTNLKRFFSLLLCDLQALFVVVLKHTIQKLALQNEGLL